MLLMAPGCINSRWPGCSRELVWAPAETLVQVVMTNLTTRPCARCDHAEPIPRRGRHRLLMTLGIKQDKIPFASSGPRPTLT